MSETQVTGLFYSFVCAWAYVCVSNDIHSLWCTMRVIESGWSYTRARPSGKWTRGRRDNRKQRTEQIKWRWINADDVVTIRIQVTVNCIHSHGWLRLKSNMWIICACKFASQTLHRPREINARTRISHTRHHQNSIIRRWFYYYYYSIHKITISHQPATGTSDTCQSVLSRTVPFRDIA